MKKHKNKDKPAILHFLQVHVLHDSSHHEPVKSHYNTLVILNASRIQFRSILTK